MGGRGEGARKKEVGREGRNKRVERHRQEWRGRKSKEERYSGRGGEKRGGGGGGRNEKKKGESEE